MRVGLVGAGPWAGMFTAPLIDGSLDLSLAGVWARRPEAASALAREHDTVPADSFEALLEGCDAVAFNVPPDESIDSGRPVPIAGPAGEGRAGSPPSLTQPRC